MKKLLVLLLFFTAQLAKAQEESTDPCVQNIEIAQQRYDEGRIQDIQILLKDCLAKGNFDKAQKSQALRLLTLAYIFLEDETEAEASMLQLLQTNHEFQVNAAIDPTEFINLHEQFRYKPLFNVGVRYIANISQPVVTGLNSAASLSNYRPVYSVQPSYFGIGINFEYEFAKNFVLYPELHYRSMAVARTDSLNGIINSFDSEPSYYSVSESFEDQNWFSVPISVKYIFNLKNNPKLKFYANLGGSVDYLLGSTRPSDGSYLETTNAPDVGFTATTTNDKNRLNFGVFGGGGITLKLGEAFISFEARYLYSFTELTTDAGALNPSAPAILNTAVQEDIYRLNHIAFSLGYTHNIYIPKQLR